MFDEYLVRLVASTISFSFSCVVILSVLLQCNVWGKMFHQLSVGLACFDLVSTSCWFFGGSYGLSNTMCSIQQYMFKAGSICKATTTVAICYLSMTVTASMQRPSAVRFLFVWGLALGSALACVAMSAMFNTSRIFCVDDDIHFHSIYVNNNAFAYLITFLVPLYVCVAIDVILYIVIRHRVWNIQVLCPCSISDPTERSEESKLIYVVNKLVVYPIVFAVLFLPEVVSAALSLSADHYNVYAVSISSLTVSLSGMVFSCNYFIQQRFYPNLSRLYLHSLNNRFWLVTPPALSQVTRSSSFTGSRSNRVITDPLIGGYHSTNETSESKSSSNQRLSCFTNFTFSDTIGSAKSYNMSSRTPPNVVEMERPSTTTVRSSGIHSYITHFTHTSATLSVPSSLSDG